MDKDIGKLDLQNYKPLREIVFESLRGAILEGVLKPGERLMEVQLAEKLGVSRTPVREAIRKLELEGLIEMVPRKGAYVADVSLNDIINLLEIRCTLEGLAASLAAKRITYQELAILKTKLYQCHENIVKGDIEKLIEVDVELHEIIYKATRNQDLSNILAGLREQIQRFRYTYVNCFRRSTKITDEHKKIIDAIEKRDSVNARIYAEEHIKGTQEFIIEQAKKNIGKMI